MILTWTVADIPPVYSREKVTAMIGRACDAWSKALAGRVKFQFLSAEETEEEEADIVFTFSKIENRNWIASHKELAGVHLIRFRDTKPNGTPHTWAISSIERFFGLKNACLLTSALHELGHALGTKGHVPMGHGCMEERQGNSYTKPTKADIDLVLATLKP